MNKRIENADHRIPLLVFAVEHFRDVVKQKFGWQLKKANGGLDLPKMGFVVTHIADFYQSYIDDIDPNRKIDRRIRLSKSEGPTPEQKRIAQLEEQVRILEQGRATNGGDVNDDGGVKEARALVKRKFVKRVTLHRKTHTEEFGRWGDDEG